MLNIFRGRRPDVTPAQVAAVLVAGIPALATLLSAFGIADMTQEQQNALADSLTWCAILAGLLIGGDATVRTARNMADAKRDTAAWMGGGTSGPSQDTDVDAVELVLRAQDDDGLEDAGSVNGGGESEAVAADK
jgi:hypothetical protein